MSDVPQTDDEAVGGTNWDDSRFVQLSGIEGVGGGTAKRILDKFGTMREVANARFDELLEVEGVGWRIARKVWNTYNVSWDGSPEEVADDTDNRVMNFLHLNYVSREDKMKVYRETDELQSPPDKYETLEEYVEGEFRGEIPDAHVDRMIENL